MSNVIAMITTEWTTGESKDTGESGWRKVCAAMQEGYRESRLSTDVTDTLCLVEADTSNADDLPTAI